PWLTPELSTGSRDQPTPRAGQYFGDMGIQYTQPLAPGMSTAESWMRTRWTTPLPHEPVKSPSNQSTLARQIALNRRFRKLSCGGRSAARSRRLDRKSVV